MTHGRQPYLGYARPSPSNQSSGPLPTCQVVFEPEVRREPAVGGACQAEGVVSEVRDGRREPESVASGLHSLRPTLASPGSADPDTPDPTSTNPDSADPEAPSTNPGSADPEAPNSNSPDPNSADSSLPGLGMPGLEIRHVRELQPRAARYGPWPDWLPADSPVRAAAVSLGIERLWAHQSVAADALAAGRHVVLTTGTASGKSLAYLLPLASAALGADLQPADPGSAHLESSTSELAGAGSAGQRLRVEVEDDVAP